MMSSSSTINRKTHACFVVHGLSATTEDMKFVSSSLIQEHGNDVDVIASTANEGILYSIFSTTDGIAEGGARLSKEVSTYLQQHPQVKRLSFCAHSNGGNYVRYAVKLLQDELEETVEFINYIAFATPHCGVRSFVGRIVGLNRFVDFFLHAGILGQTGRDMIQHGDAISSGSLLQQMSIEKSFLNAMKRFKNRTIIAAKSELIVPFASAALIESADRLEQLVGEGLMRRHYYHDKNTEGDLLWEPVVFEESKTNTSSSSSLHSPTTAADIKRDFPHIQAVYTQYSADASISSGVVIVEGGEGRSGGDIGQESKNLPSEKWWRYGSGHYSASDYNLTTTYLSEEAEMVNRLRSYMSWTTVLVDFEEFPSGLEHWRIVVSRPYITPVGADVPLFASKHCFLP
jgi:hypothetical protein